MRACERLCGWLQSASGVRCVNIWMKGHVSEVKVRVFVRGACACACVCWAWLQEVAFTARPRAHFVSDRLCSALLLRREQAGVVVEISAPPERTRRPRVSACAGHDPPCAGPYPPSVINHEVGSADPCARLSGARPDPTDVRNCINARCYLTAIPSVQRGPSRPCARPCFDFDELGRYSTSPGVAAGLGPSRRSARRRARN